MWSSGWESTCQCGEHRFDPWSRKIPHAVEQLIPWATIVSSSAATTEICMPRVSAPQQETQPQQEACALHLEGSPRLPQLEKAHV